MKLEDVNVILSQRKQVRKKCLFYNDIFIYRKAGFWYSLQCLTDILSDEFRTSSARNGEVPISKIVPINTASTVINTLQLYGMGPLL